MAIVYQLEVVDIDQRQAEGGIRAPRAGHLAFERKLARMAVEQTRHAVGQRQALERGPLFPRPPRSRVIGLRKLVPVMLGELFGDPAAGTQQQIELRRGKRLRLKIEQADRTHQPAGRCNQRNGGEGTHRECGRLQPEAEQRMLRDVRYQERLTCAADLLQGGPEIRSSGWLVEPEVADDSAPIPQLDRENDHGTAKRVRRPVHDLVKQFVFARAGARIGWRLCYPFERAANRITNMLSRLVLFGNLCNAERRSQVQGRGP